MILSILHFPFTTVFWGCYSPVYCCCEMFTDQIGFVSGRGGFMYFQSKYWKAISMLPGICKEIVCQL